MVGFFLPSVQNRIDEKTANHLTVSVFMVEWVFSCHLGGMQDGHGRWATHIEGHSTVADGRIYSLALGHIKGMRAFCGILLSTLVLPA